MADVYVMVDGVEHVLGRKLGERPSGEDYFTGTSLFPVTRSPSPMGAGVGHDVGYTGCLK